MRTVLVTGANGFIGRNLCTRLEQEQDLDILRYGRQNTAEDLEKYVGRSDFIFHIAGALRPKDESELETTNLGLTQEILDLISRSGKKTPVLLTSSIMAELDNPYGQSKKAAEEATVAWSKSSGNPAYIYRLPNTFGKWQKLDHKPVVPNFCYSIARDLPITISDPSREMTLAYVDNVVEDFVKAMNGDKEIGEDGLCQLDNLFKITLQDLADKIRSFKEHRTELPGTTLQSILDKCLYATYTSYLDPADLSYAPATQSDAADEISFIQTGPAGKVFISRIKPGMMGDSQWHSATLKKFVVVAGEAEIQLRDLYVDEGTTYQASAGEPKIFDVPVGCVHGIKNTGEGELVVISWTDSVLDSGDSDTYLTPIQQ